jgi:uncharacterized protein YdhG (YjbR/CyaY superfamily)
MQRDVATPDEYIAAVPQAQLALLQHLRSLIRKAAPKAKEEISYGMLHYDDKGGLFALAAQKNTVNLYVMATDVVAAMSNELAEIDHGKSCLRFKRLEQVPTKTIEKLLQLAKQSHERKCRA